MSGSAHGMIGMIPALGDVSASGDVLLSQEQDMGKTGCSRYQSIQNSSCIQFNKKPELRYSDETRQTHPRERAARA